MKLADLSLASPWALLLLLPVVFAGGWLAYRHYRHRDPSMRFSGLALLDGLPVSWVIKLSWLPDALRLTALGLIALALARPQLVGPPEADEAEGIDIALALDISCSMQAADFQPKDRISVAKKSVSEFVLHRKNDRVGLVVFAGEAASWVPLTLDYSLLTSLLDEVEIGLMADGTAIGSAIGTALNRLRESEAKSKVIVLLTDGDSNAGEISPKKAAEMAKELGVKIYTILIGKGGAVPFPAGKDMFGRMVYRNQVVDTNPKLLEQIAQISGGEAFVATDREELDKRLSEILDRLEKTRVEATLEAHPYAELFPWLVALSLSLMAVELLLRSTRFQRFPS